MNKLNTLFNFTPIEEEQTKTIINYLKPKNSSGHDNISFIAKPLTCIINQSLKTGRFPSKLKIAKNIFYTIDHKILIRKMEHYGITNLELQWFRSYLSNRKQYVEFYNTISYRNNNYWGASRIYIMTSPFLDIY